MTGTVFMVGEIQVKVNIVANLMKVHFTSVEALVQVQCIESLIKTHLGNNQRRIQIGKKTLWS